MEATASATGGTGGTGANGGGGTGATGGGGGTGATGVGGSGPDCGNGVNRVVVFGGAETPTTVTSVDNNYEYSSTADNWAFDSNGAPGARLNHTMVWDSTNERIVLFGGHDTTMLSDTHQYDGSWTNLNPTGTLPGYRFMHSMAFDSVRGQIVLFGGEGNTDTWEYNGTTWAQITTTTEPPGSGEMVYDTLYRRVILLADPETGTFSQTWEYRATSASPDELCDFAADEDSDGLESCAASDCEGLPCDRWYLWWRDLPVAALLAAGQCEPLCRQTERKRWSSSCLLDAHSTLPLAAMTPVTGAGEDGDRDSRLGSTTALGASA